MFYNLLEIIFLSYRQNFNMIQQEPSAMPDTADIFSRTRLLVGEAAFRRLQASRAIIFGVGGVGSWCAESLARSGIGELTIVDSDCVETSNINRQTMATLPNVGCPKVEALARRLREINPALRVNALRMVYDRTTAPQFHLEEYDAIVDAIDSLAEKADLIRHATRTGACFVSSMGTARKMDPTRLQRAEFWKVRGCPLARALRERFKREGDRPRRKFLCVYSDEVLPNLGAAPEPAEAHETNAATPSVDAPAWHARKVHTNGSLAHITGMAGLMLAGTVMQELTKEKPSPGYNSQYS